MGQAKCGSVKRSLAMVSCELPRTIAKACGLDAATRTLQTTLIISEATEH